MVRREGDGTRSNQTRTETSHTHLCPNHRAIDEGETRHSVPSYRPRPLTFTPTLHQPENQHVKFDVDVKPQNDPDRLFALMHKHISSQPNWETDLAPRIILGLWHPRFLESAKAILPYCKRSYIGMSTELARKYFWRDCETFSVAFGALATGDGARSVACPEHIVRPYGVLTMSG